MKNKTKRTCWASVFAEFVGRPYFLGDITGKQGYDCVSLCYNYLLRRGKQIPYEDWRLDDPLNYRDFFIGNEKSAMSIFESVLDNKFEIINDKKYSIGDICWVASRRKLTDDMINSPGLYCGNHIIVTTPQTGVTAARLNMVTIKKVYKI